MACEARLSYARDDGDWWLTLKSSTGSLSINLGAISDFRLSILKGWLLEFGGEIV